MPFRKKKKETRITESLSLDFLSAFPNTGRLACKTAKIMKLRTTNNTATGNFDFCKSRRMNEEGTLYAYTVRKTTNRKRFANTAVLAADYNAFKHLNTFTTAFNDLYVNLYGVTGAEFRDIRAKLFLFKYTDYIHFFLSSYKTFVSTVTAAFTVIV